MKPDDIKPGTVVQLKSGGQKMTVREVDTISGLAKVDCVWHDTNGCNQSCYYPPECLTSSDEKQSCGFGK